MPGEFPVLSHIFLELKTGSNERKSFNQRDFLLRVVSLYLPLFIKRVVDIN